MQMNMDQTFVHDLDEVLDTLYEHQVSLERKTIAQQKSESDPNAGPATTPHYYCVDEVTLLASAYTRSGRDENFPFVFRFISEQLYDDGLIRRDFGQGEHKETHYHITAKGKLFKESGGYRGRLRSERSLVWVQRAKTTAAVINAVAVIVLTWWAAQSADEDKLQDDMIIQLERRNTLLEERNTNLENALIKPDKDTLR